MFYKSITIWGILFFALLFTTTSHAKANTSFTETREIQDLKKNWVITFNDIIDEKSVTPNSILLKDTLNNNVAITLTVNENKITIQPNVPYKNKSEYTLHITPSIQSVKKKVLSKPIEMKFFTNVPTENLPKITPLNPEDYKGQALVTLSYDDGYTNWYNNVVPLHSAHNMPGTFNIIGSKVYLGNPNYMKSSQIWVAHDLGIEIASHTQTHPFLTKLSAEEVRNEFRDSQLLLNDLVGNVPILAVPYSFYNEDIKEIAKEYYSGVRVYSNETNTPSNYDPHWLKAFAVVNTTEFEDIKSWIDVAVAEKSWVIIMLHGITPERTEEYETTPEILEQVMKYINELGKDNILPVNTSEGLQLTNSWSKQ